MTTDHTHVRTRDPAWWLRTLGLYAALLVTCLVFAAPLLWMVSTSVKPNEQAMSPHTGLLPDPPSETFSIAAKNYRDTWNSHTVDFPLYLHNSLLVCLLSTSGMVVSSCIVAFGFSRIRWPGRDRLFALVVATMLVPFPVLMGSLYIIFKQLGWIGTFRPLWVPSWFGGAFSIFLLRQFFLTIPAELDEAATIDGCSRFGVFTRIILPLSKPAIAVVALFHFVFTWNDFLAPLIFLNHQEQFTLALGLQMFQTQHGDTPWNQLMAASTIVVAPVLILFILTQRLFVRGVAAQGLKE